jgi:hypothetical protein
LLLTDNLNQSPLAPPSIKFSGTVMKASKSSEQFQPASKVLMQANFIVIDKTRSGNIHAVDGIGALNYSACEATFLYRERDVDEPTPSRQF